MFSFGIRPGTNLWSIILSIVVQNKDAKLISLKVLAISFESPGFGIKMTFIFAMALVYSQKLGKQ
jgi:hypothetical protein